MDRKEFRTAAVMVFILGMFAGYIAGLWHQMAQKTQRMEDNKITAAWCRSK